MTDDLVTFLRARLDDDEQGARGADVKQGDPDWFVSRVAAAPGRSTVRSQRDKRPIARIEHVGDDEAPDNILDGYAAAEHIARHDPARVLREVEAKRRIIDACDRRVPGGGVRWLDVASARDVEIMRALALPYADHPSFRP
jgi:hypothetical protein